MLMGVALRSISHSPSTAKLGFTPHPPRYRPCPLELCQPHLLKAPGLPQQRPPRRRHRQQAQRRSPRPQIHHRLSHSQHRHTQSTGRFSTSLPTRPSTKTGPGWPRWQSCTISVYVPDPVLPTADPLILSRWIFRQNMTTTRRGYCSRLRSYYRI